MHPPHPDNQSGNSPSPHFDSNVVSPVSLISPSYYLNIIRNITLLKEYELVTGGVLISNDVLRHSLNGCQVFFQFLLVVKVRGHHDYLPCKKKKGFISCVNNQLHEVQGPLSHYENNSNCTFQNNIGHALKILDLRLLRPYSAHHKPIL